MHSLYLTLRMLLPFGDIWLDHGYIRNGTFWRSRFDLDRFGAETFRRNFDFLLQ